MGSPGHKDYTSSFTASSPTPTDTSELDEVEAWLAKNQIAASNLGRTLLQDHSLMSRWRRPGGSGVSFEKRQIVLTFIRENPDGHKSLAKKARRHHGAAFTPAALTEAHRDSQYPRSLTGSSKVPVPSLEEIRLKEDVDWIKARAFSRQVPIAVVLAELVIAGIRCVQEDEYEEGISANNGG